MIHKLRKMSKTFEKIRQKHKERGNIVGPLLPAQWVELKGNFTSKELLTIAKEIDRNFNKLKGGKNSNGNKK